MIAALKAIETQLEWDPRTADVLQGTSAGAELATMLGSGVSVDDLVAMQNGSTTDPRLQAHLADTPGMIPPLPRAALGSFGLFRRAQGVVALSGLAPRGSGNPAWLTRLAESLNPDETWVEHPDTRLVALDYDTGSRAAFGIPSSPPATIEQALRASWAIPGWFPPVQIGDRRYVDGGVASTASVDLLAADELDELFILAPMASMSGARAPGLSGFAENQALRKGMTATLRKEIAAVEAGGTRVFLLDAPAHDLAVLGGNFMDYRRRERVFTYAINALEQRVQAWEVQK
ncbi:patatin-like phospholipase family protein [Hoyosella rhizosphaerae]|nr:patatin-like phospholipase family protein [Hoyosella rhizosphaerae]